MSKETPSSRFTDANISKNAHFEAMENEFETLTNPIHYPPPRTPLNTIADPAQCRSELHESEFDLNSKFEGVRARRYSSVDRKVEAAGSIGFGYGNARISGGRSGKTQSEPNSAQSTPARNCSRASMGGVIGACTGSRVTQYIGERAGSCSRVSRTISIVDTKSSVELSHFELVEDPSFWSDHNVQVLIRIRPLSTMERVSQGCGRCLRQESAQTLVWLGQPETRFTFDHVACETISQESLFRAVGLPMVENCLSGYNSCMFAYGQTGSGKTYTMMGEMYESEGKLNEHCGITPRIFEYLFKRIRTEEEVGREEQLKYSCKCSFLEIYNEQITDLLEPTSTNLQLREDLKKGVYVENLTEYNVRNVSDVIKLLLKGAANRKMAATQMNGESSRSHSVFTCIIESQWEKDSMTHFRFARLNLVDLAGSERQKSSGAEGDRLKEAANINKSLSTLGLVIMSLVDLAHGKHRHVPYRDSRLTFLLQDSLGGNSKTTIIANVCPSICSANETLSTLKFAQRAKLIQNNAKVNEDYSGDTNALQRQIQLLKGQLSFLMKNDHLLRTLSSYVPSPEKYKFVDLAGTQSILEERIPTDSHSIGGVQKDNDCQREEDACHAQMMLQFRDEKIKRLELLVHGRLSAEQYLLQENRSLLEEMQLLRARTDRNPEISQLVAENNRLRDQLRFQNFYKHGGERFLAKELELLDQDDDTKELENCRMMNSKLIRVVDELQSELKKYMNCSETVSDSVADTLSKDPEDSKQTDICSRIENMSIQSDAEEEITSHAQTNDETPQNHRHHNMVHARPMPSQGTDKVLTDPMWTEGMVYEEDMKVLGTMNKPEEQFMPKPENHSLGCLDKQNNGLVMECREESDSMGLKAKLDRMTEDLEEVRLLNKKFQEEQAIQKSHEHQTELVREQVEMETARTILQLQEEVATLQSELDQKLFYMTQENTRLKNAIAAKEEETKLVFMEWEKASLELTGFLLDGNRSLNNVSGQIKNIAHSFPQANGLISEHVESAARICLEKEETIMQLQGSLEDAQYMVMDMRQKINSLKGATVALTDFQYQDDDKISEEENVLSRLLSDKINMEKMLERKIKYKEAQVTELQKCASAAFVVVNWLLGCSNVVCRNEVEVKVLTTKLATPTKMDDEMPNARAYANASSLKEAITKVELAKLEVLEYENAFKSFYVETETHIAAIQTNIQEVSYTHKQLVRNLGKEIHKMRKKYVELREQKTSRCCNIDSLPLETHQKYENHYLLHQIRDGLDEVNGRLEAVENFIFTGIVASGCSFTSKRVCDDEWSADSSSSSSAFSIESDSLGKKIEGSSCAYSEGEDVHPHEQDSTISHMLLANSINTQTAVFCLKKELDAVFDAFCKLRVRLATLDGPISGNCTYQEELKRLGQSPESKTREANAGFYRYTEINAEEKTDYATGFFAKFEEAHATIVEADFMLNALLQANESAKELTGMLKHTGEESKEENANLIEEVEQLKSSIHVKERNIESLHDQLQNGSLEMAKSMFLVEECFMELKSDVEEQLNKMYLDISSMTKEMLNFVSNSRLLLEDMCCEIMEKAFSLFVVLQCHLGKLEVKIPSFNEEANLHVTRHQESHSLLDQVVQKFSDDKDEAMLIDKKRGGVQKKVARKMREDELGLSCDNLIYENVTLKTELKRKNVLLEGLLFDFSLLQESASNTKDRKDEIEKLLSSLNICRHELENKTSKLGNMLNRERHLECRLGDAERVLFMSNANFVQAKETIDSLSVQNTELKEILKNLYVRKSEAEEQLEEQKEVIKSLEEEILQLTASAERKFLSSVEGIETNMRRITCERDQLLEEVQSLTEKLEMAYALADENEAIAVEARQESEASKIYAEQKEEEVKILEHSVDELECTINVLEKKVNDMDNDVERHRLIRDSLELELQNLRHRLSLVEDLTENVNSENAEQTLGQISRQLHERLLELHHTHAQIKLLEEGRTEQDKEIKQCKEYISELVLHAEAQASQYQQKYKMLEAMVCEVKIDSTNSMCTDPTSYKAEKASARTRGSSSPFRCIASLVQQMNMEKDQELSETRLRIQELEALAASKQKEVCVLNTRLAAAESMTHDVIRDLLGVKLDMTNYANLIDQYQVKKLVEEAHEQTEDFLAKEQEIINLRKHINDLIDERKSSTLETNKREGDILAAQMTIQKLQDRDQLLSAQNEMLKMDKTKLMKKMAELDEIVKTLLGTQSTQQRIQPTSTSRRSSLILRDPVVKKRLEQSEKLLTQVNGELAQYHKSNGSNPNGRTSETNYEKSKPQFR